MSKLLNITTQITQLESQLKILNRIRYKLSSQMRDYKQFQRIRMIVINTKKIIKQLQKLSKYQAKDIDKFNVQKQLQICNAIKLFIINQGHLLKQFLERAYLLQFTVIAFSGCAKIYDIFEKICKKLGMIDRLQKQRINKKVKNVKN